MLSASRHCAPSLPIRQRLFHSTSQFRNQSSNVQEDHIQEDHVQEDHVQEEVQNIFAYTRKLRSRAVKQYVIMPKELKNIHKSVALQRHRDKRLRNQHLNAFTTERLDQATLDERAGLSTKSPSTESFIRSPILLSAGHRLLAVKDNISSSQFPTTCASQMLDGYQSPYNATVVENLEAGGAIVVGKTNMDEFGMGSHSTNSKYGAVKNMKPQTGRSAGGSSGGSAVAVATRQCDMALGTDTGGSVRLPAAYTGMIGFKPSYGQFSRWGLVPYANSLDTVGILCSSNTARKSLRASIPLYHDIFHHMRSKESIDLDPTLLTKSSRSRLKGVVRKRHINQIRDPQGEANWLNKPNQPMRMRGPIRFGVPMEYNTHELTPSVRLVWQTLLENLQARGHKIVPISLPSTKHALSAYYIIAAAEAASNLAKYDGVRYGHRSQTSDGSGGVLYAKTRGEGFGNEVQRRILLGSYTLSSKAIDNYFLQAQKIRRLVQRDFDRVFALPNGLYSNEPIDLSELDENISLEDKMGPAQVDLIICPTAPTLPPNLSGITAQSFTKDYVNDVFTVPSSLAGLPAISIPAFFKKENQTLSAGMQIIGQYSDDGLVVETAQRILYAMVRNNGFRSMRVST